MCEVIRCKRCNRILTNEESIKLGYGKKCYKIMQLFQEKKNDQDLENLLERVRKLELDNTFMKYQLKHKVFVSKSKDSELDWDIPQEVKEVKNEYKIQFNVIVKELNVIFHEGFDYHEVLSPINLIEEPIEPPQVIELLN